MFSSIIQIFANTDVYMSFVTRVGVTMVRAITHADCWKSYL